MQGSFLCTGLLLLGPCVYFIFYNIFDFDDYLANVIVLFYGIVIILVSLFLTYKYAQKDFNQWKLLGTNIAIFTLSIVTIAFVRVPPLAFLIIFGIGVVLGIINLLVFAVRSRLRKTAIDS